MKKDLRHLQSYIDQQIEQFIPGGEYEIRIDIEPFFDEMDTVKEIKHDLFALITFPSYVDHCRLSDDLYLTVYIDKLFAESHLLCAKKKRLKQQEIEELELAKEYMESRGL